MYALVASQTRPIVYTIGQLKKMFGVENKYKQTRDFLIKVIDAAKKFLMMRNVIRSRIQRLKRQESRVDLHCAIKAPPANRRRTRRQGFFKAFG